MPLLSFMRSRTDSTATIPILDQVDIYSKILICKKFAISELTSLSDNSAAAAVENSFPGRVVSILSSAGTVSSGS